MVEGYRFLVPSFVFSIFQSHVALPAKNHPGGLDFMADIKNPYRRYAKGGLMLAVGLLASVLLIARSLSKLFDATLEIRVTRHSPDTWQIPEAC